MAFAPIYGFIASLTAPTASGAGLITIDPGVASAFSASLGASYTFASLSDGVNYEIVRINSVNGANLVVVRGQDDTVSSAFPAGACLRFIWNVEGIQAVSSAVPAVTITGAGGAIVTNPSTNVFVITLTIPTITAIDPVVVSGEYPTWELSFNSTGCC